MRVLALLILLTAVAAPAAPLAAASHTGCSPNGYGYTCHVNVGPVCEEVELRVGQPSTWRRCWDLRDLLP
jgi:hypothetical protein